jgi:multiple sugar transport system permease protein
MARGLIGQREWRGARLRAAFAGATALVVAGAACTLLPFVWMILTALRPPSDLFQFPVLWLPSRFDLGGFRAALERLPLVEYFGNSLLVALLTVAGQLLVSAPAAYALARLKPRFAAFWGLLLAASLLVPIETLVVPLYLQLRAFPLGIPGTGFNLLDTLAALVLPGVVSAFNIFVLRHFFARMPFEIRDSARIDGCSEWGVFFRFVLPLSVPILAILGIFGFIAAWNAFFWPLVALSDPSHYTLMLGVQKMLETGEPWNIVMAAVTLTTIPSLALFLAMQRWITRGLAFGGLFQ